MKIIMYNFIWLTWYFFYFQLTVAYHLECNHIGSLTMPSHPAQRMMKVSVLLMRGTFFLKENHEKSQHPLSLNRVNSRWKVETAWKSSDLILNSMYMLLARSYFSIFSCVPYIETLIGWLVWTRTLKFMTIAKDVSYNWGGFAHIESLVVYCLGAHFMNIWDPSFEKI